MKTRTKKSVGLKIVLPDGSMQETLMQLLVKAGLGVTITSKRTKEGKINVPWIEKVDFVRAPEMPILLQKTDFDIAIVGEDWIKNYCPTPSMGFYNFRFLLKLPIGRSGNKPVKIVLAVREDSGFKSIKNLPWDCEVATEYVGLAEKFFRERGRSDIKVTYSLGNTEQKTRFGASAIIDVTETGNSLRENGLVIIEELMESNTILVANIDSYGDINKSPYINCFQKLLWGAYQASQYVMLTANVPKKVIKEAGKIIGGLKGASCSPLMAEGWFALQSIVPRENEHDIIFKLLQIGVTDIIVNRDIPLIMS